MAWTPLVIASLCAGWMLSPDVLIRLGQGAGANQTFFLLGLIVAAGLAARSLFLVRHPQLRCKGCVNLTELLIQGVGPTLATTLLLASRMALVLLIPTGVLVTSGYAFNEIFVYWFPNFGFAFLLLVMIAALHLVSESLARKAQVVFAALVLISMVILSGAGIVTAGSGSASVDNDFSFSAPTLVGSLLLFLGLDFSQEDAHQSRRLPIGVLLVGLLLFLCWALVSMQLVAGDRLAGTTIPHLISARTILGETGRILMGITLIAGTCGVVNALFHLAIDSFRGLAARGLLPGHPHGELLRRRFVLLFALAIAFLMGKGLAGDDILDTYIQAALLLWLFVSGLQPFAAAKLLKLQKVKHRWHGIAIMLIYFSAILYLIASDPDAIHILRFLALVLIPTALLAAVWSRGGLAVKTIGNHKGKGDP